MFGPGMSHLIFGQKENIFGYSNLKINLFYTAGKLTQYYSKAFDEKIPSDVGGVEPDDIEEKVGISKNLFAPMSKYFNNRLDFSSMRRKSYKKKIAQAPFLTSKKLCAKRKNFARTERN